MFTNAGTFSIIRQVPPKEYSINHAYLACYHHSAKIEKIRQNLNMKRKTVSVGTALYRKASGKVPHLEFKLYLHSQKYYNITNFTATLLSRSHFYPFCSGYKILSRKVKLTAMLVPFPPKIVCSKFN